MRQQTVSPYVKLKANLSGTDMSITEIPPVSLSKIVWKSLKLVVGLNTNTFILCIIAEVQSKKPTVTNSYHEWEVKDNITHTASFDDLHYAKNDAALQIYLSVMYATTSIKTTVFWAVMIYSIVDRYWNFRGTSFFRLQDRGHLINIVQHITHQKDFKVLDDKILCCNLWETPKQGSCAINMNYLCKMTLFLICCKIQPWEDWLFRSASLWFQIFNLYSYVSHYRMARVCSNWPCVALPTQVKNVSASPATPGDLNPYTQMTRVKKNMPIL